MDDIKPVAWYDLDLDIHYGEKHPEFTGEGWKPLYPESALLQAKEEGRREGMREAAEIATERGWIVCSEAITRAAEGKNPPKEIDPNKWAFDRKLESY